MQNSPFRLRYTNEKHMHQPIQISSGWFEFRFVHGDKIIDRLVGQESCATFLSRDINAGIPGSTVHFEVKLSILRSMSENLLERKVFEPPSFFDHLHRVSSPLETVLELLKFAAPEGQAGIKPNIMNEDHFLLEILRLIVLYWPSTYSDEIGLAPAIRPPAALRQALAYITCKQGIVENAEDVANNSGSSLRTLESLFSKWLGIGIAGYAKMTRLKVMISEMHATNTSLSELAKRYRFSNVTRLRREIAEFDYQTANDLEPRNFYSRLKAPCF